MNTGSNSHRRQHYSFPFHASRLHAIYFYENRKQPRLRNQGRLLMTQTEYLVALTYDDDHTFESTTVASLSISVTVPLSVRETFRYSISSMLARVLVCPQIRRLQKSESTGVESTVESTVDSAHSDAKQTSKSGFVIDVRRSSARLLNIFSASRDSRPCRAVPCDTYR